MAEGSLRRAGVDDVVSVARLNQHVHVLHVDAEPEVFRPMSPEEAERFFASYLDDASHLFYVWMNPADEAVGYIWAEHQESPASPFKKQRQTVYIHQIAVDPQVRGHGVGQALVAAVEEEARRRGVSQLGVDHWTFNESAEAFFESLGFEPYNVRMRRDLGRG